MKPVMQTKLIGNELHLGNCLAACVASILEWPLWAVPAFEDARRGLHMNHLLADWLELIGRELDWRDGHQFVPGEFYIASGKSPRDVYHAVVYRDGVLVHDPHPSGAGIVSVERIYRIVEKGSV